MDLVLVSTYPPRQCGIATFAEDVEGALRPHVDRVRVVASLSADSRATDRLLYGFRQTSRGDHETAAERINASGADVVLLQHEFGIYGGTDGRYVLDLVNALTVPYCVTLHTVLAAPTDGQAHVIREMCAGAEMVFVFSPRAALLLVGAQLVDDGKIQVVPHGAPPELLERVPQDQQDDEVSRLVGRDVRGRQLVSTFGLLSPGKGLEHAIRAIPLVVDDAPDVLYVVAGATHPEVVRHHGESYRRGLEKLGAALGVEDHLVFVNRYLSDAELVALLRRSDVFVTPYPNREQIVSGTLTFAVAAGCAIVSTPYYHAEDMSGSGAVLLADFDDSASLASHLHTLLTDPVAMRAARSAARALGEQLSWDAVGQHMHRLLETAAKRGRVVA